MIDDPYGSDVLAGFSRRAAPPPPPVVVIEPELVVEDPESGFTGAVVGASDGVVRLEDRRGLVRSFPLSGVFLLDGARVRLARGPAPAPARQRTASGSFAVTDARARVALPSRIFVEGRHDAELVERVWGDDLRIEGVVVEYLAGVDHLDEALHRAQPDAGRRIGVLVDHLVVGSKESRIAESVARGPWRDHVLVVGHPYVDVWQAVKAERLGMTSWPEVPRGTDWKHGICAALGWPHGDQADLARAWQHILGRVRTFADLEPAFLGRVEELIDFVTATPDAEHGG